jgi:hypothetical protein
LPPNAILALEASLLYFNLKTALMKDTAQDLADFQHFAAKCFFIQKVDIDQRSFTTSHETATV